MNAAPKLDFVTEPHGRSNETAGSAFPLKARPVKNPRSYEEMREHAKNRFSKTLAYLAR